MKVELKVVDCAVDREQVGLVLPATIGRGGNADLVIAHKEVSRRHCRLFIYRDSVHIQDLDSLNGTYVEGRYLSNAETAILPGEHFTIGPLTFQIQYVRSDLSPSSFGGAGSTSSRRTVSRAGSSSHAPALDDLSPIRHAATEKME